MRFFYLIKTLSYNARFLNGELQMQETQLVSIPMSLNLSCGEYPATLEDLLQAVYPNISTQSIHPSFFAERAILTPRIKILI